MKKIELSKKEVKLLVSILEETLDSRKQSGCTDADPYEEEIFNKKERKQMAISIYGEENAKEMDYYMCNMDYVIHLIDRVKEQI